MYQFWIVSYEHFILILRVSDLAGSKCVKNVVCIDCVGLRYVFIIFCSLKTKLCRYIKKTFMKLINLLNLIKNRKAAKKGILTFKVLKMYSNKLDNQNCSYYECPVSLIRLTKVTVIIQQSQIFHLLNLQWKLRLLFCK